MDFEITFTGRESGAIGIFYSITETYTADSEAEAVKLCFADSRTEKLHIDKIVSDDQEAENLLNDFNYVGSRHHY